MATKTIPEYLEDERRSREETQLRTDEEADRIQLLHQGHHRTRKQPNLELPAPLEIVVKQKKPAVAKARKPALVKARKLPMAKVRKPAVANGEKTCRDQNDKTCWRRSEKATSRAKDGNESPQEGVTSRA